MKKTPLWSPSKKRIEQSNLTAYMRFLKEKFYLDFNEYSSLYNWSVNDLSSFWQSIWQYAGVIHSSSYGKVLVGSDIPTARWFEGTRLNFAENLLRHKGEKIAITYQNEDGGRSTFTYQELQHRVAGLAHALRKLGIKKGDRIAAFITNRPEAIIGMLATSSIGAIWSSCSPDFGFEGVLDRFGQIEPKVLIAINGYQYNGKPIHLNDTLIKLGKSISSLEKIVVIEPLGDYPMDPSKKMTRWEDFISEQPDELRFEQLPFDHPLYIMYSSGTTGKPKCIVHGAGGSLLQHFKELSLHTDLKPEDIITYYTTCGWMMWNWLVSSLYIGATIYLFDGSPSYPDLGVLFRAIEKEKVNIFGTSPKFLSACESSGLVPQKDFDLSSLKTILSTGSPLTDHHFDFVYQDIKPDVQLASISGGTDIISCFMLGNPIGPVFKNELQCRGLGMKVETYNDEGQPITDEVGELVCSAPFPSRPIQFWNDPQGEKYRKAYFDQYPGVWRHGDYVKITPEGGCIVYGRSDATLNAGGIRIGTAEIYEPVESLPQIKDSIVIGKRVGDDTIIVLFVVLNEGYKLSPDLEQKIKSTLREKRTPRHVPAEIHQVSEIPRTISGKKVELAVTRLIHGEAITNKEALANPETLEEFIQTPAS
ncbi:acetoacetate--CoA ligase [Marinoscillum sp. MHG1-6]|uniref:acetoacetate--CoA ligase n=1 Tax=Marinoscillum sp. MHG1-6 TaxID=2959627 RepID=UPI002157D3A9|nr:acetoacetate--CoA ligase [Marinoscillum sp. MHG1-6]